MSVYEDKASTDEHSVARDWISKNAATGAAAPTISEGTVILPEVTFAAPPHGKHRA